MSVLAGAIAGLSADLTTGVEGAVPGPEAGGGIVPLGGPYWMIGRVGGSGPGGLGSLTANMVVSNT